MCLTWGKLHGTTFHLFFGSKTKKYLLARYWIVILLPPCRVSEIPPHTCARFVGCANLRGFNECISSNLSDKISNTAKNAEKILSFSPKIEDFFLKKILNFWRWEKNPQFLEKRTQDYSQCRDNFLQYLTLAVLMGLE